MTVIKMIIITINNIREPKTIKSIHAFTFTLRLLFAISFIHNCQLFPELLLGD